VGSDEGAWGVGEASIGVDEGGGAEGCDVTCGGALVGTPTSAEEVVGTGDALVGLSYREGVAVGSLEEVGAEGIMGSSADEGCRVGRWVSRVGGLFGRRVGDTGGYLPDKRSDH
jgi:hypothetical protein